MQVWPVGVILVDRRVLLGTPVKTTTNRREALSGDKLLRDMKPSRYVTPRRPAQKPS